MLVHAIQLDPIGVAATAQAFLSYFTQDTADLSPRACSLRAALRPPCEAVDERKCRHGGYGCQAEDDIICLAVCIMKLG